jgi:hypothetical protein
VLKSKSLQIALLVTLIASLLSFAKFNNCRSTNWASPDVYIHMCYSDISALYGARQINTDKWPYTSADNSLEYPVLTGVVTYLTGLLIDDPNGYRAYFDLNAFLIVLLLFVSVFILWRLLPNTHRYFQSRQQSLVHSLLIGISGLFYLLFLLSTSLKANLISQHSF